jgi:hypothetical protein
MKVEKLVNDSFETEYTLTSFMDYLSVCGTGKLAAWAYHSVALLNESAVEEIDLENYLGYNISIAGDNIGNVDVIGNKYFGCMGQDGNLKFSEMPKELWDTAGKSQTIEGYNNDLYILNQGKVSRLNIANTLEDYVSLNGIGGFDDMLEINKNGEIYALSYDNNGYNIYKAGTDKKVISLNSDEFIKKYVPSITYGTITLSKLLKDKDDNIYVVALYKKYGSKVGYRVLTFLILKILKKSRLPHPI